MQCYVCYLKSVLGYKFLNLDTCHANILYLRYGSVVIFRSQKGSYSKKIRETLLYVMKHCYRDHLSIFFFGSRFKI